MKENKTLNLGECTRNSAPYLNLKRGSYSSRRRGVFVDGEIIQLRQLKQCMNYSREVQDKVVLYCMVVTTLYGNR